MFTLLVNFRNRLLGHRWLIELQCATRQSQFVIDRVRLDLEDSMPPIESCSVAALLTYLSNDPRGWRALRLNLQNRASRQARGGIVPMLQSDSCTPNQSPFLPTRINIATAPTDCDQNRNSNDAPEKELQIKSLCSSIRSFHYRVFCLRARSKVCNI